MDPADGRLWVVGLGGLLGKALGRATIARARFAHRPFDWASGRVAADIERAAAEFGARSDPWTVVWCAGAGIIGTAPADLERETDVLAAVLAGLGRAEGPGVLVLSSSAGGVYGGTRAIPITEDTDPAPLSAYGRNKLTQERLLATWAIETGHRACAARIANLYGPGQRLSKPQGLISQICKATLLRQPISVYVSLDTLRDYVYVDDCARTLLDIAEQLPSEAPGTFATKIVSSGNSVSIGSLLAEARRVLGRRPSVVMASSPASSLQGSTLAFRSIVWPQFDLPTTPLAVGIDRTAEDVRRQIARGELVPTPT